MAKLTPEFAQGWTKGRVSLRAALLEVLEDNNHPIWESGNLQEDLVNLVKGNTK